VFIDDNCTRLQGRVNRLKSRHAHREYPWSRTRRFITNVMIKEATGDEMVVTASAMVYRFRMTEAAPYVGSYEFRLKRVNGELKIHSRRAVLDQEALRDHGALSIIF
jgi:p-cumate 2,3-dioxygenase beta subunit